VIPDDPVTATLVILSTAVTGLGGLLAAIVRSIVKGDLIPRQVLVDERAEGRRLLDEARELAALERARADLSQSQLEGLAREQGRTTVALLASNEQREARAALEGRGRDGLVEPPASTPGP
jgi:hypothetical protein